MNRENNPLVAAIISHLLRQMGFVEHNIPIKNIGTTPATQTLGELITELK